jgi:sugar phosphate isomerase/epimerase
MTLNRREFLSIAAAAPAVVAAAEPLAASQAARGATAAGQMFVCMHEASSAGFDFKPAMEGYAKAGIRAVELTLPKLTEFTSKESPAVARRLLGDLGLRAVSCGSVLGLAEPNPGRDKTLIELKARLELVQAMGIDRLVCPSAARTPYTEDDYKKGVDNLREAGELARPYNVTLMLEFSRTTTFCGSLPTALKLVRDASHPNVRVMMDIYHFWGGVSKFEDLELLRDGELHHLHFEDVPAEPPREVLEQRHRVFPGQGIAPLKRIVALLKQKKYAGPASVEMFDPAVTSMDPYQVALRAKAAVEPLIA